MFKSPIWCKLFFHNLCIIKCVNHNTRLLGCKRCKKRFVMNDVYKSFLRYDNDKQFMKDLMITYELTIEDMLGAKYLVDN